MDREENSRKAFEDYLRKIKDKTSSQANVKTSLAKKKKPAKRQAYQGKRTSRNRVERPLYQLTTLVLCLLFVFGLSLSILKALYTIQVVESKELGQKSSRQYYRPIVLPAKRGDIYDRNHSLLASSKFVYRLGMTPENARAIYEDGPDQKMIAQTLAKILKLDEAKLLAQMQEVDETYVQIKSEVSAEKAKEISQWLNEKYVGGFRLDAEPQRQYYNGNLASETIGYANREEQDLKGMLGVELSYNSVLSGQAGVSYAARDNFMSEGVLPNSQLNQLNVQNGKSIELTIDLGIQKILQEELENAVLAFLPKKQGMAIVMNPNNGEVLASASYPYFKSSDPFARPSTFKGEKWDYSKNIKYLDNEVWKDRVIGSIYEPGSTFKAITAAIGLEEGVTHEDRYYSDQPIKVQAHTIHCHTTHADEPMSLAFARSCNPIFVQIAQELGIKKYYDYMKAFGLRDLTGIDLPGESNSYFHSDPAPIDLATLSFGEQSAITPLQLVAAYSALVNGGNLYKPQIVKRVFSNEDQSSKHTKAELVRRVISPETSARVRNLLKYMVDYSGLVYTTEGIDLGGKTSTSTNEATMEYTISFASVAPIDKPEIVVLIIIQEPSGENPSSVSVQGVVTRASSRILDYMKFERKYTEEDVSRLGQQIAMPDLIGTSVSDSLKILSAEFMNTRLDPDLKDHNDLVQKQVPAAGTPLYHGSTVFLYTDANLALPMIRLPDFRGKTYHEALEEAGKHGLILQFTGDLSGIVSEQTVLNQEGNEQDVIQGSQVQLAMLSRDDYNNLLNSKTKETSPEP